MGKKSLLSSTSKKKSNSENGEEKVKKSPAHADAVKKVKPKSPKKKTTTTVAKKKAAAGKGAKKTATTGTAAKKKAAPMKKVASSRSATAKSSVKPKAKTATAAKKKPVSIKDLLKKKFDISVPEKQYTPPADKSRKADISSPPFVAGGTPEETDRVRQLLFKKFDLAASGIGSKLEPEPAPLSEPELTPQKPLADMLEEAPPVSGQVDNDTKASGYSSLEKEAIIPIPKRMDPIQKVAAIGILALIVLVGLVVSASISNTAKFYMKPVKGELEIWKGKFSPMGEKKFVTLGETPMPDQPKDIYGKNEIFPFIFGSYVNQADALLNVSDMPNFELIKRTLNKALAFAASPELSELIQRRLSKINLMALVYKADILADKNTAADLTSAREALERAMGLDLDEAEKGLVKQKLQWVHERQALLEQMESEAEAVDTVLPPDRE